MAIACLALSLWSARTALAQPPKPGVTGYQVEWVYRVRYGFIDEWWDLFRKYQIAILDRAKQLGYIVDYRVYHPQLHTDEAARWDYRIEITYKDVSPRHRTRRDRAAAIPRRRSRKRDNRRWSSRSTTGICRFSK
jgi:hypothetical protein